MSIIITGSSGFIGSFIRDDLLNKDYSVIGIDIVPSGLSHVNYKEFNVDISEHINLELPVQVSAILHLAAKIRVDESMSNPEMYYKNNVTGTINLLKWCRKNNIYRILFASTAAVYGGEPRYGGYIEQDASNPLSVYGKTKLMCETILQDYSRSYGFNGCIFRFFNVCGGSELNHGTPIHLLPLIINNINNNKDVCIYGNDYNTKDGTCERDYIHLKDISNAFILFLENGIQNKEFKIYNLGSGNGYTVKEIVENIVIRMNKNIDIIQYKERRPGDLDSLIANSNLIYKDLKWKAEESLDTMIKDTIESFNK